MRNSLTEKREVYTKESNTLIINKPRSSKKRICKRCEGHTKRPGPYKFVQEMNQSDIVHLSLLSESNYIYFFFQSIALLSTAHCVLPFIVGLHLMQTSSVVFL